jgi:hypothetical protein
MFMAAENYNKSLLGETWDYLKERKKWWLLPLVLLIVLVAVFIILSHSAVLSPFIYALG